MTACPHCDKSLPLAAGIRLLKGAEVIEMGQMMITMEAQAEERREANRIHQEQCIAAEIAKLKVSSPKTETL